MQNRITAPNLAELYRKAAERYESLPAFATRRRALEWTPVSFRRLYEQGMNLATGLIDLGVQPREHIGLFGDNRQEWILADYGVQLCGAADVPRGRDVTDTELRYIVDHAGIRVAFVETPALQDRLLKLRADLSRLKEIILLDPEAEPGPGVRTLRGVMDRGAALRRAGDTGTEERVRGIRPDDLFTLIYTSGTTGRPKGVMLTHANMISQIESIPLPVSCSDRVLSILPVWHIFERVFEMLTISCGACTYYTSIRHFGDDLRNVEPTFMGSAPRLWETLHQRILRGVRTAHPVRRALFHTAYFLARQYHGSVAFFLGRRPILEPPPWWEKTVMGPLHGLRWLLLLPWFGFFNAAVLERIRLGAGGSLKATVSGGGALPLDIDRFFNYVGIAVYEGYGLTETSPVLAVRKSDALVIGTVGPPIPNTALRISCMDTGKVLFPNPDLPGEGRGRRGEILVRGPQVMKGYYRDPEATEKAIREGWFHTGDLGVMTYNGCLKIMGRCKETVVLTSGENVEPGPIEMRLRQSSLIEQCAVVGQDRKWIAALIVPALDGLRERGIAADSVEELAGDPGVNRMIRDEIRGEISVANGFKSFERVHDFRLLTKPFEVGDELTNLFKLKRHVIEEKYASLIEEIFDGH